MYEHVKEAAARILAGEVLQAGSVSAGRGLVIDWRTIRSGEIVDDGGDSFDQAHLFVALAGPEACELLFELPEPEPRWAVRWTDPENRREPEGWILRDGVRRWEGTEAEARIKARRYGGSTYEGSTTVYEARRVS
jgi:hypothetical protein